MAFTRLPMGLRRRKQDRRASAAVLSGLAAFAVLQLVLGLEAETNLREKRDPVYARRLLLLQSRLASGSTRPRTVVMVGSSLTLFGFQAAEGEKAWAAALGRPVAAFNFGVAGSSPLTELLTWRRLRREGVPLDLLLIEVRPPCLDTRFPQGECLEDLLPAEHLSAKELRLVERYLGSARRSLGRDRLSASLLPLYANRSNILKCLAPSLAPTETLSVYGDMDRSGGLRVPGGPLPLAVRQKNIQILWKVYQSPFTGFHLGGPGCEELCELLASCRRRGVPAALVLMPEGPVMRSWYAPEAWRAIQDWLDQVGRVYDTPVVNAREWIDDEEDFVDSSHLMGAGADKFTERLGREYILPLMRRPPSSP